VALARGRCHSFGADGQVRQNLKRKKKREKEKNKD
jgi:hypothetical protein